VTKDIATPRPGNITLQAGQRPVLDADEAAALARRSVLLDARGRAAYLGGPAQPGSAPTGHIPGAVSAPTGENLDANGQFKSDEALRARFAALGVDGANPVGVYCGSGNAAAHEVAALAAIGIDAALYVGSWSAWSADPKRPVAIGRESAAAKGCFAR
jgi:thiosulfate/3-mercaptopyruvate sulfurtransferase